MTKIKECPISHERQKGLVNCLYCHKKIGLTFAEKLKKEVDAIDISIKQKVIDLMNEGKTIGDACKKTGLETIVVCEIINRNLDEYKFLRKEARQ